MNVYELEVQHRADLAAQLASIDWLKAFPEAREAVLELVQDRKTELYCRETLYKYHNEVAQMFTGAERAALEARNEVEQLPKILQIEADLRRLRSCLPEEKGSNSSWSKRIEAAKQAPILEIAQAVTDQLRYQGNRATIPCLFHEDRTPSCTLYLDTNTFYCFGCNEGGDSIKLFMKANCVDFSTAVRSLT